MYQMMNEKGRIWNDHCKSKTPELEILNEAKSTGEGVTVRREWVERCLVKEVSEEL